MTVDQLREGVYWLAERLYNENGLMSRRKPFFDQLWRHREQTEDEPRNSGVRNQESGVGSWP